VTNRGLRATLPIIKKSGRRNLYYALLNCRFEHDIRGTLALKLQELRGSDRFIVANETHMREYAPSRLVFVLSEEQDAAQLRLIEVARKPDARRRFQPKFWLRLFKANRSDPGTRIRRIAPVELWNATTSTLMSPGGTHARAVAVLQLPSGRDLAFGFGYDKIAGVGALEADAHEFRSPGLRVLYIGHSWSFDRPHWTKGKAYCF
jgi:hypothetical protein